MAVFDVARSRRIQRSALFVLIFGLLNWGLGRLYVRREIANGRLGSIERQFDQVRRQITVLAIGDSHMATGFDPRVWSGAFNFALYGENYVYNYFKLRHILDRNPQVKTVLLPLDLHSFSAWRADKELLDSYWVRYANYLEIGWKSRKPFEYLGKYMRGRLFPYLGEMGAVRVTPRRDRSKRPRQRSEIVQGFVVKTGTYDENREKLAVRRVKLHFFGHRAYDPLVAHYFGRILELCAARGKTLVLIKFPVSEPYYSLATRRIARERIDSRVEAMIKPYGNVQVFDYQKAFFGRDQELFDDPDHLNEAGARILSLDIMRRLSGLTAAPSSLISPGCPRIQDAACGGRNQNSPPS